MSDLIPFAPRTLGNDTVNTVDGRHLHAYLVISKDYSTWVKAQIRRANLLENRDFVVFSQPGENPRGGRPSLEYHFTFDAAKHVAMISSAEKGHEVRDYFIAKEKEITALPFNRPQVHNPMSQVMIDMVLRVDALEYEITEQKHEQAALATTLAMVEGKATLALDDAQTMTIETFVLKNGLLSQYPPAQWRGMATWLTGFCQQYNLKVLKTPTPGRLWDDANAYPIPALGAWLDHDTRKARQMRLVPKQDTP